MLLSLWVIILIQRREKATSFFTLKIQVFQSTTPTMNLRHKSPPRVCFFIFQEKYTHEPFESKCFCLSLPGLSERGVQIISIQCGFCMGTYLNINNVQCL